MESSGRISKSPKHKNFKNNYEWPVETAQSKRNKQSHGKSRTGIQY